MPSALTSIVQYTTLGTGRDGLVKLLRPPVQTTVVIHHHFIIISIFIHILYLSLSATRSVSIPPIPAQMFDRLFYTCNSNRGSLLTLPTPSPVRPPSCLYVDSIYYIRPATDWDYV